MRRIQQRCREGSPGTLVELCFLELMSPSLAEAVNALAGRGLRRITVVPLFLAQGGHLKRDLPGIISEVQAAHRELRIDVTSAIGDSAQLIEAIADWALAQHRARQP